MHLRTAVLAAFLQCGFAELQAQPVVVSVDLRIGTYKAGLQRGQSAAERDLVGGKLRVMSDGGLAARTDQKLESALQTLYSQHGIEIAVAGSCASPDEERGYISGYNAVMFAELDKRFGPRFVERTEKQAEAVARQRSR